MLGVSFDMLADVDIVAGAFVAMNLLLFKVTHAVGVQASSLTGALVDDASDIGSEMDVSGATMATTLEKARGTPVEESLLSC